MALTRPRYSQIYDTDYKQSVRLATTTDVGNLLATGSIVNSVDGVSVAANDRILVKDQSDSKQNGIYRVVTVGTGSNGTWIRTLDADASDKVTSGMSATVGEGNTNAYKTFKLANPDPIVLGTTELTFVNPYVAGGGGVAGSDGQVQFNSNGSIAGDSGLSYDSATNALTVSGNISAQNLLGNLITAAGVIEGAVFVEDSVLNIEIGNSNIQVYLSDDIAISSSTASNVVVVSTTGLAVDGNVSADYFIGDGSQLTNLTLPAAYTNSNVSAYLPTHTGNIGGTLLTNNQPNITNLGTLGSLAVTGNVSANYFIGDGSQLTGIEVGSVYGDSNVASYLPTYTGNVSGTIVTSSQPNITSLGTLGSLAVTGNVVSGHMLPSANVTYDLGSPSMRWRTGYFASSTIDLGGHTISVDPETGFSFTVSGSAPMTMSSDGSLSANTLTASTVTIASNTQASSTSSAALVVSGGIGIAKNAYIGGNASITSNLTLSGRLIVSSSAGSYGQVLTSTGSAVTWATPSLPSEITDGTGSGISVNGTDISFVIDGFDVGMIDANGLDIGAGSTSAPTYKGNVRVSGGSASSNGGVEFMNTAYNSGYGWRLIGPDEGSGSTPLIVQYRQNSSTWTEINRFTPDGFKGSLVDGTSIKTIGNSVTFAANTPTKIADLASPNTLDGVYALKIFFGAGYASNGSTTIYWNTTYAATISAVSAVGYYNSSPAETVNFVATQHHRTANHPTFTLKSDSSNTPQAGYGNLSLYVSFPQITIIDSWDIKVKKLI